MSRELRFRAWNLTRKCWQPRYDFHINSDGYGTAEYPDGDCNLDDLVVEQYTGLKDKNGKEIYEGDIVRYADDYEENAEVVFDDGGFQVEWPINIERLEGDITCMMEVIGNIHEPPKDFRPEHLKRMGVSISKGGEE